MKKYISYVTLLGAFALSSYHTKAQSLGNASSLYEPMAAQYFLNQYMANPAMAGIDTGLHVFAAYQRQWSDIPGSPKAKALTVDYMLGKRVGVGMNIYNDKAGLLNNTKVAFTYAYHLPLSVNDNSTLHFGLSAAFIARRLDTKSVSGDPTDEEISAYNRRDNYFESDFGMSFTRNGLSLQAAMPNLISYVKNRSADVGINRSIFFAAAGYKFQTGEQLSSVEPKICFRGVKGYDNIVDVGANFVFLGNLLNAFGMYHTSKSISAGAGINYKSLGALQFAYTSQTSGLSTYTNGTFELNLMINLFN